MQLEDMTTKKGKMIIVSNPKHYPVTINEAGQTLGGYKQAKVSSGDSIVKRAIDNAVIMVVS